MGGWRKLWFVLQNQLLLSYSSKEDYEKKLAPFKDVLNLVPGTVVRPTKGPRFTIETSTNLIYTFVSISNTISQLILCAIYGVGNVCNFFFLDFLFFFASFCRLTFLFGHFLTINSAYILNLHTIFV